MNIILIILKYLYKKNDVHIKKKKIASNDSEEASERKLTTTYK